MSARKKTSSAKGKPKTPKAKKPVSKPIAKGVSPFGNGFWFKNWIPGAIILILPLLLYFQSTSFGYVLDDKIVLSENNFVKAGTAGISDIFGQESFTGFLGEQQNLVAGARYRPLSLATFALEWQWFEEAPGISHFINILLYALTGLLLFRLFFIIAPNKGAQPWYFTLPFLGALIFVLHPIHTEVVANIKGRDEILALLLSLGTLYFMLRYFVQNKIIYLPLAAITFLLAIFAKENSLTFLAVIPLLVMLFMRIPLQKIVLACLPILGAAIVYILIRYSVIGFLLDSGTEVTSIMNDPFLEATAGQKYATITYTFGWYLKLLVIPHPLTHDYYPYHVPLVNWGNWRTLLSLVLVIGLIGLAIWKWKKTRIFTFSILYFFLTLSIVSNLAFSVGTFMNERFLYMPSVGFALAFAYLLSRKLPEWLPGISGKAVAWGLAGLMIVGFSARTFTRVPDWENSATLEAASIKVSVNSARSNQYYAYSLYEKSLVENDREKKRALYDEAWPYVNKALEIYPGYTDAHTCRGGIAAGYYQLDGDVDKMLSTFEHTLRTAPVPFVDQFLNWMVGRQLHAAKMAAFFHRVGYDHFWISRKDAGTARKYLKMGLRAAPGDSQLQADLAAIP